MRIRRKYGHATGNSLADKDTVERVLVIIGQA